LASALEVAVQELTATAGGYLRNVIRQPGVTCSVCATPVQGYPRCFRCQQVHSTPHLADLVAPLVYGIQGAQSGTLLRHYKDDPSARVRALHGRIVNRLLYVGIMLHETCIERRTGRPVTLRLTVPSLRGRAGTHPFLMTALATRAVNPAPLLVRARGAAAHRMVSPEQFTLQPGVSLAGQHILILDDTWTTGANAQSAVLTVRAAGADTVSVLVLGRWLVPGFADNAEFIRTRLRRDYDPRICPVTGGDCP